MNSNQAQLIKVTTSRITELTLEEFFARVRELDAAGGFLGNNGVTIKTEPAF